MFRLPIQSNNNSGTQPVKGWQRPLDWLPLPKVPEGEEGVNILWAVYPKDIMHSLARFKSYFTGDWTIDWGDGGSVENYNGHRYVVHSYNFSELPNETLTLEGFKQVIIKIRTKSVNDKLDEFGFATSYSSYAGVGSITALDLEIRSTNISDLFKKSGVVNHPPYLQRFNIEGGITNIDFIDIDEFDSLRVIENCHLKPGTNANYMAKDMKTVEKISFPDHFFENIINFQLAFESSSIEEIPAIDLSTVQNIDNMVRKATRLRRFPCTNINLDLNLELTNLSQTALIEVFNNLVDLTGLEPKTINIRTTPGREFLTPEERNIALSKNWTIIE